MKSISFPKDARDIWINPDGGSHLLATFIDSKGRKQYRYSSKVVKKNQKEKFKRAERLGRNLRRIRNKLARDLARQRFSREKVIALIIRLIDLGYFRVGTEKYSIENGTFGISTIRKNHIRFEGENAFFEFIGKKGVEWQVVITDSDCVDNLKKLYSLIGDEDNCLFKYNNGKGYNVVTAAMINQYLKKYGVTAKDFRTFHATRICAETLYGMPIKSKKEINKTISRAIEHTAIRLGHTPSICRSTYVNPKVIKFYQSGSVERLRPYCLSI